MIEMPSISNDIEDGFLLGLSTFSYYCEFWGYTWYVCTPLYTSFSGTPRNAFWRCFPPVSQECLAAKRSLGKVAVKPELKVLIGLNMVLPKAKVHNLVDAQREPNIFLHHVANLEVSILSCYPQIVTGWWFQPTPLKNDGLRQWVSWDDDIPNIWKVIKIHGSKPPTSG